MLFKAVSTAFFIEKRFFIEKFQKLTEPENICYDAHPEAIKKGWNVTMNIITKEDDRLILHGFNALSNSATFKFGDALIILDARPFKPNMDPSRACQFRVEINNRTIVDATAVAIADSLLKHKNTLFIEVENQYYIQDANYVLADDLDPEIMTKIRLSEIVRIIE